MKTLHAVTVPGRTGNWSIDTYVDPAIAEEWREDGVDVIEVVNSVPEWAAGFPRLYCFMQDVWNLRNPWKR